MYMRHNMRLDNIISYFMRCRILSVEQVSAITASISCLCRFTDIFALCRVSSLPPLHQGAYLLRCIIPCLLFLLAGCGSYYTVSVDSLQDNLPAGMVYALEPATEEQRNDPLLFAHVARSLKPAFVAQRLRLTEHPAEAGAIVTVAYGMLAPQTRIHKTTTTRRTPVVVGHEKKARIEYVDVEEPDINITTEQRAFLHLQATRKADGSVLWRTHIRCSGGSEDFRTLLQAMEPVLPQALSVNNATIRQYEVFIDDNGNVSVDAL